MLPWGPGAVVRRHQIAKATFKLGDASRLSKDRGPRCFILTRSMGKIGRRPEPNSHRHSRERHDRFSVTGNLDESDPRFALSLRREVTIAAIPCCVPTRSALFCCSWRVAACSFCSACYEGQTEGEMGRWRAGNGQGGGITRGLEGGMRRGLEGEMGRQAESG